MTLYGFYSNKQRLMIGYHEALNFKSNFIIVTEVYPADTEEEALKYFETKHIKNFPDSEFSGPITHVSRVEFGRFFQNGYGGVKLSGVKFSAK